MNRRWPTYFPRQRYKNLTEDMTDLIKGRYGPLYSIANEELRKLALEAREAERGQSWEGRLAAAARVSLRRKIS